MEIDIYQTCPCHTEKKIKFCCGKEIVADLTQILSLSKSKQSIAALENLDRTIAKLGPRDCLLTLKTHILITLHEYEKAREVNQQFFESHPNHPIGFQHRALLLAAESRSEEAINALQDALDASPKNEVPLSMSSAFRIVGMLLLSQGDVIAGRAHLVFASDLRGGNDETIAQLVIQSYRAPEIPLQIKHDFAPSLPEQDAQWAESLTVAIKLGRRGRWRAALKRAVALNQEFPNVPEILQSIAAFSGFLGRRDMSARAFLDLSLIESLAVDARVDAMSMSLLLDEQPLTDSLELTLVEYEFDDAESLLEQATANPRLISGTITAHEYVDEDAPPPIAAFLLLDRDEVTSAAGVEFNQFPSIVAEILIYGKQTDRAARLELFVVRDHRFEKIQQELQEIFANWISDPESVHVVDELTLLDHAMSFQWHLPRDMSIEERHTFVSEMKRNEILDVWTSIPFRALDDQSAEQAKSDPNKQIVLSALVSIMEQGTEEQLTGGFDFNLLRQKLGLPLPEKIEADGLDIDALSPVRMQLVDFENLDDDSLIKAYVSASTIGNFRVLKDCSRFVLARPHLEKYVRFEMVYATLAKLTVDTDEAISLVQKARQHATSSGRSAGKWLVEELATRMERGRIENCRDLIRTIQANHSDEPDVQYHLTATLQRFGIIGADGRMATPAADVAASEQEKSTSNIWTPESDVSTQHAEPASETGSTSKLWLPE